VRQSQYMLQIIKCFDINCCSKARSNIFDTILQNRFLPAQVLLKDEDFGPTPCTPNTTEGSYGSLSNRIALSNLIPPFLQYTKTPFDLYCPSIQSELQNRLCPICHIYGCQKCNGMS